MAKPADTVLPAPLIDAGVDLKKLPFMPLHVERLRTSDMLSMTSGDEFKCAVMLWCAAWHKTPAGSLPDDDRALANLAGLGFAVDVWLPLRKGALHGWVKCSDGRLYHPLICEEAKKAWLKKLEYEAGKEADRQRKANSRKAAKGFQHEMFPSDGRQLSAGQAAVSGGQAGESSGTQAASASGPGESALKGQGQGQIQKEDSPATVFDPTTNTHYPRGFAEAWRLYPKRSGSNSKTDAFRQWQARVDDGVSPEALIDGTRRYAEWCRATEKEGTEFVKLAATFYGRGNHFLEQYDLPATPPGRVAPIKNGGFATTDYTAGVAKNGTF